MVCWGCLLASAVDQQLYKLHRKPVAVPRLLPGSSRFIGAWSGSIARLAARRCIVAVEIAFSCEFAHLKPRCAKSACATAPELSGQLCFLQFRQQACSDGFLQCPCCELFQNVLQVQAPIPMRLLQGDVGLLSAADAYMHLQKRLASVVGGFLLVAKCPPRMRAGFNGA